MGKSITEAIPPEWVGQRVKVLTSVLFVAEIKGRLSEIGDDYIVIGRDIVNVRYIVKIRKV